MNDVAQSQVGPVSQQDERELRIAAATSERELRVKADQHERETRELVQRLEEELRRRERERVEERLEVLNLLIDIALLIPRLQR